MIAYIAYSFIALFTARWAYGWFAYHPKQGWNTPVAAAFGAGVGALWPAVALGAVVRKLAKHWPLVMCPQAEIDWKHQDRRNRIAAQEQRLDELLAEPTEHCSNCGHEGHNSCKNTEGYMCPRCGDAVDASKYACPNFRCDYSPRHHCKRCGSSLGPDGCPSRVCLESRIASTMRVPNPLCPPAQPEFCPVCRLHHPYGESCPPQVLREWTMICGMDQQMREAATRKPDSFAFCEQHQWQERDDRGDLACRPYHSGKNLAALGPGIPVSPIQIRG